jgi:hypothetical protein
MFNRIALVMQISQSSFGISTKNPLMMAYIFVAFTYHKQTDMGKTKGNAQQQRIFPTTKINKSTKNNLKKKYHFLK